MLAGPAEVRDFAPRDGGRAVLVRCAECFADCLQRTARRWLERQSAIDEPTKARSAVVGDAVVAERLALTFNDFARRSGTQTVLELGAALREGKTKYPRCQPGSGRWRAAASIRGLHG